MLVGEGKISPLRVTMGEFSVRVASESVGLQTFNPRATSPNVTPMTTATFHPIPDTGGLNALASATAAAVEVNPSAAVLVVDAQAQPVGAVGSEITVGTRRVHVDEPAALGGGGEAPNPSSTISRRCCHARSSRTASGPSGWASRCRA